MGKRCRMFGVFTGLLFFCCLWGLTDVPVYGESYCVIDEGNFLSSEEASALESRVLELAELYEVGLGVIITDDSQGMSPEDYAKHTYETYLASEKDGLLLAVCMDQREYYAVSKGVVKDCFTEDDYQQAAAELGEYLRAEAYGEALSSWVEGVDILLYVYGFPSVIAQAYTQDGEYNLSEDNVQTDYSFFSYGFSVAGEFFLWHLLFGCLVAMLSVGVMWFQCKTGRAPQNAAHYVVADSLKLDVREDVFLRSETISTPKPKKDNNSDDDFSSGDHDNYGGSGGSF